MIRNWIPILLFAATCFGESVSAWRFHTAAHTREADLCEIAEWDRTLLHLHGALSRRTVLLYILSGLSMSEHWILIQSVWRKDCGQFHLNL